MSKQPIRRQIVVGISIFLLGGLAEKILSPMGDVWPYVSVVIPQLPSILLTKLLGIAMMGNVLLSGISVYQWHRDHKALIPSKGMLWDTKSNAYCPSCRSLLANHSEHYQNGEGFECLKCDRIVYLGP